MCFCVFVKQFFKIFNSTFEFNLFFFLFVCFVFINHTWLQSSTRSLQNPETENIETFGSDFFLFPALLSKNVPNLSRNKTRLIILIKCVGVGEFGVKQTWEMEWCFLEKVFQGGERLERGDHYHILHQFLN